MPLPCPVSASELPALSSHLYAAWHTYYWTSWNITSFHKVQHTVVRWRKYLDLGSEDREVWSAFLLAAFLLTDVG